MRLVTDAVYFSVREAVQPIVYIPIEPRYAGTILVRTSGGAPDLVQTLRREIPRIQPGLQVREVVPFETFVTQQMIHERLLAALSTFSARLALVLAVSGMCGVLNYAVTRERRELGLRMALGGRPTHVVRLITTLLLGVVGLGALLGVAGGLAFGRAMQSLLFEMASTDPMPLMASVLALASAATLAVLPPTIRAVRFDHGNAPKRRMTRRLIPAKGSCVTRTCGAVRRLRAQRRQVSVWS